MRRCRYFLDISGEENLVAMLRVFVAREQPGLAECRELARAMDVLFGDTLNVRIIVHRNTSVVTAYTLAATGPHNG